MSTAALIGWWSGEGGSSFPTRIDIPRFFGLHHPRPSAADHTTEMSKHLTNSPNDLVVENLRGLLRQNPEVALIEHERVIVRRNIQDKVTLIAGGGSGHEPAHAGYVGKGMLDAAVAGTIFASPSTKQILAGLKAIRSPKGTLIIVKNYTGDILHFGLASEKFMAEAQAGTKTKLVVVQDDVAVGRKQGGMVGRRGLAGTVIVHKVAGAAAESGATLEQVASVARSVVDNLVTVGASLDHCSVPGRGGSVEDTLKNDEMEIGMGIHNENGISRKSPIPSTKELVQELLKLLLDPKDTDRAFLKFDKNDETVLLINNLGGLSNLELAAFCENAASILDSTYAIKPKRIYAGAFMTALNGPGASITLLNLSKCIGGAQSILALLDAPTLAPGWTPCLPASAWTDASPRILPATEAEKTTVTSQATLNKALFTRMIQNGASALIKAEPQITKYDTVAGDGDCGETLVNGANAVVKALESGAIRVDNAVHAIADIAAIVEDSMGGTSGALYSIYLNAFAQGIRESKCSGDLTTEAVSHASSFALSSLGKYTPARSGDRTLMDALEPFVETLIRTQSLAQAAEAASKGAQGTSTMAAKFGRATYVEAEGLQQESVPDPGAIGIAVLVAGFAS